MEQPLLQVKDLRVGFHLRPGTLTAVDGISFAIHERETEADPVREVHLDIVEVHKLLIAKKMRFAQCVAPQD